MNSTADCPEYQRQCMACSTDGSKEAGHGRKRLHSPDVRQHPCGRQYGQTAEPSRQGCTFWGREVEIEKLEVFTLEKPVWKHQGRVRTYR